MDPFVFHQRPIEGAATIAQGSRTKNFSYAAEGIARRASSLAG